MTHALLIAILFVLILSSPLARQTVGIITLVVLIPAWTPADVSGNVIPFVKLQVERKRD